MQQARCVQSNVQFLFLSLLHSILYVGQKVKLVHFIRAFSPTCLLHGFEKRNRTQDLSHFYLFATLIFFSLLLYEVQICGVRAHGCLLVSFSHLRCCMLQTLQS